jgi:hypothetical protein
MEHAVERWYATNESLQTLVEQRWNPMLAEAARALSNETRARLRDLLSSALGGSEPAATVMTDLYRVGFDLGQVGQAAWPALDRQEVVEPYQTAIQAEEIPVRKSFADWLLFRRIATVRQRLFGADLAQEILPEEKQKRMPEVARAAFLQKIEITVAEKIPFLPAKFSDTLAAEYVAKFRAEVGVRLSELRTQLLEAHAALQTPFDINASILASMRELDEQASKIAGDILPLAQQGKLEPLDADGKTVPLPDAELAA